MRIIKKIMKVDAFGFSKAVFTEVGKLIVIEVSDGHMFVLKDCRCTLLLGATEWWVHSVIVLLYSFFFRRLQAFRQQRSIREFIVSHALSQIQCRAPSIQNYVELLEQLIRTNTANMIQFVFLVILGHFLQGCRVRWCELLLGNVVGLYTVE